ncbi:MAG: TRAP transporter fused permease subunit, partial [Alphaproteobacteria bacterium]|nr:TRAP transporter fused permease subunit [Alphaproteobacteria bacterium]
MGPAAGRVLAAAIVVIGVAWLVDLPRRFGIAIIAEEYLGLVAGLTVAAAFLRHPLRGGRPGVLDALAAAAGLAAWVWMAIHYSDWLLDVANRGPEKWVPATVALVLLVEAVRRGCGTAIAVLVAAIGAYGFVGHLVPGPLQGARIAPSRLVLYLYADSNGVPGIVLGVGASVVLGFIAMGAALRKAGGTEVFTDLALAAMGRFRGGAAKVGILASSIFGTLSGSTVGNVMSTGVVTIPLMKRSGFPPHYAAAVEAVASNGGQLAPPVMGATAFLIAEFLQVSYTEVVLAALVPAAIYYLVLFAQVDAYAVRLGLKGLPPEDRPRAGPTLVRGWPFLLPLGLLIWLLFGLSWAPGKAALAAAGLALVVGAIVGRRLPGPRFWADLLAEAGETLLPVLLVCAAAGIVIGTVNITGIGFTLTLILSQLGEAFGIGVLLAVTAVAAVVLGMGMPTAAVYVVLSVLLAPALVRAGVAPMAAHLFIFYFGLLSMITPPVAIASYAAGSLAGSDLWRTGLAGMRLAVAAYLLPFAFVLQPALVLQGGALDAAVAIAGALVAGWLLAQALSGGSALRVALLAAAALAVGA